MTPPKRHLPGLTFRSVSASILGMLLVGVLIQFSNIVTDFTGRMPAHHTLPLPAIAVFIGFSLISAAVFSLWRFRLLTRPEILCVLFSLLVAAPLMAQGFWQMMIPITAAIPRTAEFGKMDAVSEKLWPHGKNLIENALNEEHADAVTFRGNCQWQETEVEKDQTKVIPAIANTAKSDISAIRIEVPLLEDGEPYLLLDEPYLLSVLARINGLGADATCYCRLYYDDSEQFNQEAFISRSQKTITYLHQTGFVRLGSYGLTLPETIKEKVILEFGLIGIGQVEFHDPKLMSVSALEGAYRGRNTVTQEQFDSLPANVRAGLLVRPESLFSIAGLKFLLAGYIPIKDWINPITAWSSLAILMIAATFSLAAIMRKQWVESERYPLPLTRIPLALLGGENSPDGPVPAIWRNRLMWMGLGGSAFWCLMRVWNQFNPEVPDMNVGVQLSPYFKDVSWGLMWERVNFSLSAVFLSIAIFMELNVLISIVIGFFLFRCQYWAGQATAWNANPDYPFFACQEVAAFGAYALMIAIFTRKHFWNVLRDAVSGGWKPADGEALSSRVALLILAATFVGVAAWAQWVGVPIAGILLMFGFLVAVGFVAMKIRAECGTPASSFTPTQAALVIPLLGGIAVFSPSGMVAATMAAFLISKHLFFNIPGLQLEMIELSRRYKVRPRHIGAACALGAVGGILFGGWLCLSSAYSIGGDKVRYKDAFNEQRRYFIPYNNDLDEATDKLVGNAQEVSGIQPKTWAYLYAAGVTAFLTLLRQIFAGFWFHPVGFIVGIGYDSLGERVWGSCLAAWAIRSLVLKLGGAVTVRHKLLPFFVGVFLGAVFSYIVLFALNGYIFFFHPGMETHTVLF